MKTGIVGVVFFWWILFGWLCRHYMNECQSMNTSKYGIRIKHKWPYWDLQKKRCYLSCQCHATQILSSSLLLTIHPCRRVICKGEAFLHANANMLTSYEQNHCNIRAFSAAIAKAYITACMLSTPYFFDYLNESKIPCRSHLNKKTPTELSKVIGVWLMLGMHYFKPLPYCVPKKLACNISTSRHIQLFHKPYSTITFLLFLNDLTCLWGFLLFYFKILIQTLELTFDIYYSTVRFSSLCSRPLILMMKWTL